MEGKLEGKERQHQIEESVFDLLETEKLTRLQLLAKLSEDDNLKNWVGPIDEDDLHIALDGLSKSKRIACYCLGQVYNINKERFEPNFTYCLSS